MRAVYTGHEALTFTDYTDQDTGKTLHAEPGHVYDIAPASGRLAGDIPEPWFVPVDQEAWAQAKAAVEAARLAAESAAAEGTGDGDAGTTPEGDEDAAGNPDADNPEGQSF